MKSMTYGGGVYFFVVRVGKRVTGRPPPVGVAKKMGGGYIIEKFGVQE
jgi:hypothetical protein